jgi:hypothetical protein
MSDYIWRYEQKADALPYGEPVMVPAGIAGKVAGVTYGVSSGMARGNHYRLGYYHLHQAPDGSWSLHRDQYEAGDPRHLMDFLRGLGRRAPAADLKVVK